MTEKEFKEKLQDVIKDADSTYDCGSVEEAQKHARCAMQGLVLIFEYLTESKLVDYRGKPIEF
jgi:hypothetical protein